MACILCFFASTLAQSYITHTPTHPHTHTHTHPHPHTHTHTHTRVRVCGVYFSPIPAKFHGCFIPSAPCALANVPSRLGFCPHCKRLWLIPTKQGGVGGGGYVRPWTDQMKGGRGSWGLCVSKDGTLPLRWVSAPWHARHGLLPTVARHWHHL